MHVSLFLLFTSLLLQFLLLLHITLACSLCHVTVHTLHHTLLICWSLIFECFIECISNLWYLISEVFMLMPHSFIKLLFVHSFVHLSVTMPVKCEKASVHCDSDSDDAAAAAVSHDDDAAHEHDSFFSLLDSVKSHHFSCVLSVSSLQAVSAVSDSDSDSKDLLYTSDPAQLSAFDALSYTEMSVSTSTHLLLSHSVHSVSSLLSMPSKCSCTASSVVVLKVLISVTQFCVHCLKDLMSHYSYHTEQCRHSAQDQKCFYCSQQRHVCISVSDCNLCILCLLMLTFLYRFLHFLSRLPSILSLRSLMLLLHMRLLMISMLICMHALCFNRYFCFFFCPLL